MCIWLQIYRRMLILNIKFTIIDSLTYELYILKFAESKQINKLIDRLEDKNDSYRQRK